MYPSIPSVILTFSTQILSPTTNGNVLNPTTGAFSFNWFIPKLELASTTPIPFELNVGTNLMFWDNPLSLLTISTPPTVLPSNIAFNVIAVFPIAIIFGLDV